MSILFLDAAGAPWDGQIVREKGIGGSEYAQCQLAEALARAGVDVHVVVFRDENKAHRVIEGVHYGHGELHDLKTVIASRMTPIPESLQGLRRIVSLTDAGPHQIAACDLLVGVSQWQLSHFPKQAKRMIPPIIEHTTAEKQWGKFVYCSGKVKGLDATLQVWKTLKDKRLIPEIAQLYVTTAGWDLPVEGSVEAAGAVWMGLKTPAQIREEIASAQGLFYINTYPETFCAVAAIAEASNTRPIIACAGSSGGLREAVPSLNLIPTNGGAVPLQLIADAVNRAMQEDYHGAPVNYSENRIVQKWLNVL